MKIKRTTRLPRPSLAWLIWPVLPAFLSSALAQEPAESPSKNRIGLSGRFGFNIKAKFENVPGWPSQTDPGPRMGQRLDRFYDDGYVGVDYANNAGDLTGFWGYQRSSQASATDISFHSARPALDARREVTDDPQYGFEVTYARELGQFDVNKIGSISWGLEGGFGYTSLSIEDDGALSGTVPLRTDSYTHSFGTPPWSFAPPGYSGQRSDVTGKPLLTDAPDSSTDSMVSGSITGWRKLEADLFSLRLGPYLNIPVMERVSVLVGGGFAVVRVDSTFSFAETTTTMAGGPVYRSASSSRDDYLYGGYASAQVGVDVSKHIGLFVGAQYQNVGDFDQKTASKRAILDLQNSVFLNAGVGFSF